MAKRYYYDCPIEAAYMSKWHDMHFCNLVDILLTNLSEHKGKKFYIYPDSLPILEPKVGDTVYWEHGIGVITEMLPGGLTLTLDGRGPDLRPEDVKIIQRDGKPFFWPKEESDA